MLERRDHGNHSTLASRDQAWLIKLHHCNESLKLMTLEHINLRAALELIGKRHHELINGHAEILDWAMKMVSGKMKVSLLNIQIFDYVPYTLVPKDVQYPNIPFTNPNERVEMPFLTPRIIPNEPLTIHLIPRSKPPGEPSKPPVEPKKKKNESLECKIFILTLSM